MIVIYLCFTFTSYACSIPDPTSDTVIVTGGVLQQFNVSRYGREGWLEELPQLRHGRQEHGCGGYVSGEDMVCMVVTEYLG